MGVPPHPLMLLLCEETRVSLWFSLATMKARCLGALSSCLESMARLTDSSEVGRAVVIPSLDVVYLSRWKDVADLADGVSLDDAGLNPWPVSG